jgi:hypothetical protein
MNSLAIVRLLGNAEMWTGWKFVDWITADSSFGAQRARRFFEQVKCHTRLAPSKRSVAIV